MTNRACENCACFFVQTHPQNPMEKQGFCRLNPPLSQIMRVEVPRVDKNGVPVFGRDGKPTTEAAQRLMYSYPPTMPAMVCFDGWRPLDYQPGERVGARMDGVAEELGRALAMMGFPLPPGPKLDG